MDSSLEIHATPSTGRGSGSESRAIPALRCVCYGQKKPPAAQPRSLIKMLTPPLMDAHCPFALLESPPLTEEAVALATLLVPPLMDACSPLAVLPPPPVTDAFGPLT